MVYDFVMGNVKVVTPITIKNILQWIGFQTEIQRDLIYDEFNKLFQLYQDVNS